MLTFYNDYLRMSRKTKQEKRLGMTAAFAAGTPEFPSVAAPKKQKHHGTLKERTAQLSYSNKSNFLFLTQRERRFGYLITFQF